MPIFACAVAMPIRPDSRFSAFGNQLTDGRMESKGSWYRLRYPRVCRALIPQVFCRQRDSMNAPR
jgi:hypothetical protein